MPNNFEYWFDQESTANHKLLVFKYFAKLEKMELSMVKQNVSNEAIKRTPISWLNHDLCATS